MPKESWVVRLLSKDSNNGPVWSTNLLGRLRSICKAPRLRATATAVLGDVFASTTLRRKKEAFDGVRRFQRAELDRHWRSGEAVWRSCHLMVAELSLLQRYWATPYWCKLPHT